jgi:hypothetical protein
MNSQFRISNPPSFPIKLGFNQSRVIKFNYFPNIRGIIFDSLIISSNDITNPNKKVILQGKGYIINPVRSDSIYAITGSQSNGSFLSINKISGNASLLGLSGYSEITGLSIRPSNKNIFGCIPLPNTKLIRINSQEGDGYFAKNISLAYIRSIAFDTNDVLYCSTLSGDLYKYNIITDDTLLIKNTGILNLYGITINPMNGQMWGISLNNKIYKIDKTTGNSVQVGVPGINLTQSIAFDSKGSLYGLAGFGSLVTNFLKYDTATGTATIIGSTNYKALNSFVIAPFSQSPLLPVSYNLYQNYPNPFNAGTTFEFDIPNTTNIDLTIYDVLGRKIITLASGQYSAGNYKIKFSEPNLPSGLYLYRLKTEGFTSVKKFVIVK